MLIADFKSLLIKQSGDAEAIYWTLTDWDLIIKEALLTFGVISGYWKEQILIETNTAKQFYNLLIEDDVKTGFDNIKIGLTYQDIVNWIIIDLLGYEDISSDNEIRNLITNAINDFQSETKLILDRQRYNIIVGQNITISSDVLDIVKAYYIDSNGLYYSLQLTDENNLHLVKGKYTLDQGRPKFYSLSNLSSQIIDLFPKPSENGYLELIYVKGKDLPEDFIANCLIPNNLVPYLKYKLEADLFSKDGISNDPYRAEYCTKRWIEGLLIGKNYSTIINSKLNGINKIPSSLQDFDSFRYGWLNDRETITKKINSLALAGYNILALNRMPTNVYSLLLEVISNAPINNAEINLRSDYIPYLLDYCLHLSSIRDGIAAINKTATNLESFIKISVEHNQYLQQRKITYLDLLQKSKYPIRQARIEKEENAA